MLVMLCNFISTNNYLSMEYHYDSSNSCKKYNNLMFEAGRNINLLKGLDVSLSAKHSGSLSENNFNSCLFDANLILSSVDNPYSAVIGISTGTITTHYTPLKSLGLKVGLNINISYYLYLLLRYLNKFFIFLFFKVIYLKKYYITRILYNVIKNIFKLLNFLFLFKNHCHIFIGTNIFKMYEKKIEGERDHVYEWLFKLIFS